MENSQQEPEEGVHYEENAQLQQEPVPQAEQEWQVVETPARQEEQKRVKSDPSDSVDRSGFIHGLSVGLGIGCIATFVIMWVAVFFTPKLPPAITYENLLAVFIYPLIYLLAVGLVALTAGIVREYFGRRKI